MDVFCSNFLLMIGQGLEKVRSIIELNTVIASDVMIINKKCTTNLFMQNNRNLHIKLNQS